MKFSHHIGRPAEDCGTVRAAEDRRHEKVIQPFVQSTHIVRFDHSEDGVYSLRDASLTGFQTKKAIERLLIVCGSDE